MYCLQPRSDGFPPPPVSRLTCDALQQTGTPGLTATPGVRLLEQRPHTKASERPVPAVLQVWSHQGPPGISDLRGSVRSKPFFQQHKVLFAFFTLALWVTVEFSRSFVVCNIATNRIQRQTWESRCLPLSQEIKGTGKCKILLLFLLEYYVMENVLF